MLKKMLTIYFSIYLALFPIATQASFAPQITNQFNNKALTQDIIWYENETVSINDEQYTALVPRLYLANATLDDLSRYPQYETPA